MAGIFEGTMNYLWGEHGSKPIVPDLPTTQEIAKKAVDANVANFEDIRGLAQKYNAASVDDLKKTLENISPGSTKLIEQGTQFISSLMRGEIPQDVSDQIARLGASKAMGGGYFGSGMARNLVARDLGTTSLNLMQQGLGSAERWLQQLSGMAPRFNYASMFVSPEFQMGWEDTNWNKTWLKNQINAMPSPDDLAWNKMISSIGYTFDYIGSSMVQKYTGGGPAQLGDTMEYKNPYGSGEFGSQPGHNDMGLLSRTSSNGDWADEANDSNSFGGGMFDFNGMGSGMGGMT